MNHTESLERGGKPILSFHLARYAGLPAFLGGVLYLLLGFVAGIQGVPLWGHVLLDAVRYAVLAAGVVGLYLHLRQSGRFGLLGLVGFAISILVLAMITILDIGIILDTRVEQMYEDLGAVRGLGMILGAVLFGVATLRAATFPRGGAWLLIATVVIYPASIVAMLVSGGTLGGWIWLLPELSYALGWAWLGFGLWSASRTRA